MFSIVQKDYRNWKKRCVQSFVSQLLSGTATTGFVTQTLLPPQSLMPLLPADDRWQIIAEHSVKCVKVNPGEEGAFIEIQQI